MRKKVGKGRSEEEREREVGKGVGSVGGSKLGRELKRVALMEWDLKMPPWDLPELEQNAGEANLSSVVGSRGGRAERQPAVGLLDCSVDLKLGGLGDFGLVDKWEEQRKASGILMAPAPPQAAAAGSLKRPRTAAAGNQNVSCLVDGCKSDLSSCREYYRRHKVCEAHSKTPVVLVTGQEQRFCQQCSRFHLLVEFDEVKRSCRKRLDGHNRRRRKPQPELINSGNLFANRYGARLTSYPKILPTTATDANWSGVIKSEEDAFYGHHPPPMHFMNRVQQPLPHYSSSFNRSLKEGKQFPFLHEGEGMSIDSRDALEPAAVCQPLLKAISSAAESSGNKILFSDGLPPVLDSDCALSLLSSSTQASGINLGHMAPADSIPIGQPLHSDLQYGADTGGYVRPHAASENVSPTGFSCSGVENDHIGTVLVSGANEAELHCQSLFHIEGEGPSHGASHSLPFSWQ